MFKVIETRIVNSKNPDSKLLIVLPKRKLSQGRYKYYICEVCGHVSFTYSSYKDHRVIHSINLTNKDNKDVNKVQKTRLSCEICHGTFKSNKNRKKHMDTVHNVTLVKCELCGKNMKSSNLKAHMRLLHNDNKIVCEICRKVFKTKKYLQVHKKYVHTDKRWPCSMCDRVFKGEFLVKWHMKKDHVYSSSGSDGNKNKTKPSRSEGDNKRSKPPIHVCPFCAKSVSNRYIERHMKLFHSDCEGIKCKDCDKVCLSVEHLKLHFRDSHSDKKYMCEFCAASFRNSSMLRVHLNTVHSDARNYKCNICDKTFKIKVGLKKHLYVHEPVHRFQCNKCNLTFKWKQALDNHLKKCKVTKENPELD